MSQSPVASVRRGFQFSLVTLLVLTSWVALVCIALKTPSEVWATVVFLLAFVALLGSGLGIVYCTGRSRAFAAGFVAFSLGYAACLFVTEKQFSGQIVNESEMPTTQFALWLCQKMHPTDVYGMPGASTGGGVGGGGGFFSVDSSLSANQGDSGDAAQAVSQDPFGGPGPAGGPTAVAIASPTMYSFQQFAIIVHSAFAMLLGLIGGVIAQFLYAGRGASPTDRQAGEPR